MLNHRSRKDMLLGPMWEENFVLLTEILMAPKATKDQKDLYRKITALRNEPLHKIYIIELFYYKQKLESKMKFAKWYRKTHEQKMAIGEIDKFT